MISVRRRRRIFGNEHEDDRKQIILVSMYLFASGHNGKQTDHSAGDLGSRPYAVKIQEKNINKCT